MTILTDDETGLVAGGLLPLVAALGLVAANVHNIRDFFIGFFEGLED